MVNTLCNLWKGTRVVSKFPSTEVLKGTRYDSGTLSWLSGIMMKFAKLLGRSKIEWRLAVSYMLRMLLYFITICNFVTHKAFLLCVILCTILKIFPQLHIGLYQLSLCLNSADQFFAVLIKSYLLLSLPLSLSLLFLLLSLPLSLSYYYYYFKTNSEAPECKSFHLPLIAKRRSN